MRRNLLLFVCLALCFNGAVKAQDETVKAQNETYKSTICVNAGFSIVGSLLSVSDGKSSSVPAIQATYDYSVSKWFSLGGAISFQNMKVDYTDANYGNYNTSIKRLNVAMRALLHYGSFEKIDLYSGLRLGYTNWNVSSTSKDPAYNPDDVIKAGGFAPQVILFGIRGYLSDHIGLNSEVTVGAPHWFSMGLNYRF